MSKISELSDGGVIQGGDTLIAVRSGGNVKVTYGGTTTANIDGGNIDGTVIGGTTPAAGNFTTGSFTGDVSFGDNDKAVFGAGSDLQIYHDGSNSYVSEAGTGNLYLNTTNGGGVFLTSAGENLAGFNSNGAVNLYYDNAAKLATTSTGVDVTGTITADGLDLGDASVLNVGTIALDTIKGDADDNTNITFAGSDTTTFTQGGTQRLAVNTLGINVTGTVTADGLTVDGTGDLGTIGNGDFNAAAALGFQSDRAFFGYSSSQNALIQSGASKGVVVEVNSDTLDSGTRAALFASNGDISFYEDTGTTAKLFWDASAESLGIGTSSPSSVLHAKGGSIATPATASAFLTNATARLVVNHGNEYGAYIGYVNSSNDAVAIQSARSNGTTGPLSLNTFGGNVGIGETSPDETLHVSGGGIKVDGSATIASGSGAGLFLDYGSNIGGITALDQGVAWKTLRLNASDHQFYIAGGEKMRINTNGRAGFGTTNIDGQVTAYANSDTVPGFSMVSDANHGMHILHRATDGDFSFEREDAGTKNEFMRVDRSSGNVYFNEKVGIGTTSPGRNLEIAGTGSDVGLNIVKNTVGTVRFAYDSTGPYILDEDSNPFRVYTGGSERVRIDSSGNVGIGTSSPAVKADIHKSDGTGRQNVLRVLAGGNANNNGATLALGSTQTQAGYVSGLQTATNEGALTFGVQSSGAYSESMRIDSSDRIGIGVTPFSAGGNGSNLMVGDPTSDVGAGLTIGATTTGDIQFGDATTASRSLCWAVKIPTL